MGREESLKGGVTRACGPEKIPIFEATALTAPPVGILSDIDDTLTWEGRLIPEAFSALDALQRAGYLVIPVTGRPAAWADQIARTWPVDGVVAENGGLWSYLDAGRVKTSFVQPERERRKNRARLSALGEEILSRVPGAGLASDQPYRALDLAIDFCEDVSPLSESSIQEILNLFRDAGASAKRSSIHVNGWFGEWDKASGCEQLIQALTGAPATPERWLYFGDSANDEPMFQRYPASIGVANIQAALPHMEIHPRWLTRAVGGYGFAEAARQLLNRFPKVA